MSRKSSDSFPVTAASKPRPRRGKTATTTPLPEKVTNHVPASPPMSEGEWVASVRAILNRINRG